MSTDYIKQLFSFHGRVNRATYWGVTIILLLFMLITDPLIKTMPPSNIKVALILIIVVPFIWVNIAVQVKRWQDLGRSGLWFFINFIPVLGLIASVIMLGFIPGSTAPNKYGNAC